MGPSILASVATDLTTILIDDHDLFRAGLRTLLENEHVKVVGDGRVSDETLELAVRLQPRLILLDIQSDENTAFPLLERLLTELPNTAIVVLTRSNDDADIYRSVRAGAQGYLFKDLAIPELATSLRAIAAGDAALAPAVTRSVLRFLATGRVPRIDDSNMSDREVDVLRLLAQGFDNNQIAEELNISAKTVKNHVSSIFLKLELTNRVQAAVFAVRSGIA